MREAQYFVAQYLVICYNRDMLRHPAVLRAD